jgi:cytochrome bd-type quinol oxidase subunit 2
MFSPAHLLDWANEQFLISVFGLAILVIGVWLFARTSQNIQLTTEDRTIISFLGIASFFYLLLTWVWNADYGIRKDWDLFAPSAFVYMLLAGFVLVRLLKGQDKKSERALAQAALFMTAVAALHTATWLVSNMWPAGLS